MIQVLLLSRGALADEWLRATQAVCGSEPEAMESLSLDWRGTPESDEAHVQKSLSRLRRSGPVLVLTDLHGSTPTNLAASSAADPDVAVVAGANLAMALKLACSDRDSTSLDELARWICAKGRSSIRLVEGAGRPSKP